jgi:hypothetical protein
MRTFCRIVVLLGATLAVPSGMQLLATTAETDSSNIAALRCSLAIESTPESAYVLVDGRLAGHTPISVDSLGSGIHILTLQHPDVESWLTEPIIDTVKLLGGEHKALRYSLGIRYFITSIPFGAEVLVSDSVIGTTPIVTAPPSSFESITLRKSGYEPTSVQLALNRGSIISIPLKKIWQNDENGGSYFKDNDGKSSKSAGRYITGAATVLSGVAAAYFKIKADDRYQQYLGSNNSSLLSQTNRLDTAAAIATVATQIGLGLFTYFLFTQ